MLSLIEIGSGEEDKNVKIQKFTMNQQSRRQRQIRDKLW